MTAADSPLRRLCDRVGIEAGYRDVWGREHRTSDATRIALLTAMGVIRSASEVEAALRDREARDWTSCLPAAAVQRVDAVPYEWPLRCEAAVAGKALRWSLALESGDSLRGGVRPAELEKTGEGHVGGKRYVEAMFRLREPLPTGYHRFTLEGGDAQADAAMMLIIVPRRCHSPPGRGRSARVWGPALQLYALRSRRNWGMGDFTDLRHAVEIMVREGAGIVGLSPLHALFPEDADRASPYSPSSRAHLNSLFIDVEAVPGFAACAAARERVASPRFQSQLRALREGELVDYARVAELKLDVLRALYRSFCEQDLATATARATAYRRFLADGGESLLWFALYHALQEDFHARDRTVWGWPRWPETYRNPAAPAVREYLERNRERVEFHAWLQWIANEQLGVCSRRARELGAAVGLYLDLAVSIDGGGAEAWVWQDLYALPAGIGAPPDAFNLQGQNWGLPPIVPERLVASGYAPFVAALRGNMRHAGALRIDHVMGLTRLFWVPPGAAPAQGAYVRYPLRDLLGIVALESRRNRCLVVGEDLGTLPDGLAGELEAAGVLSYRVLLFEKKADGGYKLPAAYPEQALATASTHDLPTLKGFWLGHDLEVRAKLSLFPTDALKEQQAVERAQDRARLIKALKREKLLPRGISSRPAPVPRMTPAFARAIHAYLARSRARLMTLQMEDALGQLDQVNMPATGSEHPNWRRKLPLDLGKWGADARVRALAKTLRAERGTGRSRAAGRMTRRASGGGREAPERRDAQKRRRRAKRLSRQGNFSGRGVHQKRQG